MTNRFTAGLPQILERCQPLQVGFIPDSDCAPLVYAHESGLFQRYELDVELKRETRWATIRDKVTYGELAAAHAPATLPFITNLELEAGQCPSVSGLVLSLQGNAITLSRSLWNEGVRDAQSLRDLVYRDWGRRTYTFAVVFPHSPQYFLLRQWFKAGGIVPHNEVRIIVLPPAQMFPTLKLGYIDGYCSGDPWTSLAADAQAGVCVATSADLSPLHPEKVLMVRRDFAEERGTEHERLIAALIEACAFCDRAENRTLLSEILAQPRYINAPPECLDGSLLKAPDEELTSGAGRNPSIFFRHNANEPTEHKAAWVMGQLHELMAQNVLKLPPAMRVPALNNVFLPDIFQRAKTAALNQMEALKREADRYEAKLKEPV